MRLHQESLLLFRLRHLRETLGFSLCGLFEYYPVNILPQITLITQRNTASCIITQRKTDWSLCGFGGWGFVCVNLRDLRETLGFRLCGLLEYSCVLFSRR